MEIFYDEFDCTRDSDSVIFQGYIHLQLSKQRQSGEYWRTADTFENSKIHRKQNAPYYQTSYLFHFKENISGQCPNVDT